MMHALRSFRFRILLPVLVITSFIITLMNILFTTFYTQMIMRQEQEVNAVGFETVTSSIAPLIETNINDVRSILSQDAVASYARLHDAPASELIHARLRCRDYLRTELSQHKDIFGLLFMRKDGSLFGALPEANLFLDSPEDNPFPEDMKKKIFDAQLGQTIWIGPMSGEALYGFEDARATKAVMIAAWKSVHVTYGECYSMMLMDESIFDKLFAPLLDGKSSWHLFTENLTEICHSGPDTCSDPEKLIGQSNSNQVFRDEEGHSFSSFQTVLDSPPWVIVREVSMEGHEAVVSAVRRMTAVFGAVLLVIVVIVFLLWHIRFIRQFKSLVNGIVRLGEGDLESTSFVPTSIEEFKQMQTEINRTREALNHQMDTIRQMEREQAKLENERKEQERIAQELVLAREIQANALPNVFPAFPDRTEFDLYASMTPAKEIGGDFYDFFLVDDDHLAIVIADVSGKGIPAALFMMVTKELIKTQLMTGLTPAEALSNVNLKLRDNNESRMFVTVWAAVVDLSTGRGLACNAGHEHPAFRLAGGSFELLKYNHNLFITGLPGIQYDNREFEMKPGDCLFVYTDGIPEANDATSAMFGEERLLHVLNQNCDAGLKSLLDNVRSAVDSFVKGAPQFDDLTMLAFRYYGPSSRKPDHTNR